MFDFIRQRAYLQLAIALAAGTALGAWLPPPLALLRDSWWLWLLLLAAIAGLWWELRSRADALALAPGFLLLVLLGYLNLATARAIPLAAPLRTYAAAQAASASAAVGKPLHNAALRLEGRVASLPKLQRGHLRFMLDVRQARPSLPRPPDGQPWPPAPAWEVHPGRCLVFLQLKRDAPPLDVNYGDIVQLTADVEEVDPPRNFGQFDYRAWLLQQGTVLSGYSFGGGGLHVILPSPGGLWPALARLRERLTAQLARHAAPALAPLAVSVVYGDKITELPDATTQSFQRAGLSHILVASGTQVSLLIALLAALGWRQRGDFSLKALPGQLTAAGVTLGAVLIYAGIAGMETSILRALVMGAVVLAARLLRRESDGMTSLAQAALVVLIASPQQLFYAGFQLSFGATFGLIYLNGITLPWIKQLGQAPPGLAPREAETTGWAGWRERLIARLPQWRRGARVILLEGLSTTIGAQLFVLPVLAAGFHQLSLWGFASNALAVPLSFGLLLAGGAASLGPGALPVLSHAFDWTVGGLTWLLNAVAVFFGHLPGSNLAVPSPPWWYIVAAYGLLLFGGEWIKAQRAQRPAPDTPASGTSPEIVDSPLALGALRAAPALTALCVLALAGGLAYWLLVPQPELAALALPGAEAYLWRPPGLAPWVVLRSRWLSRSRNADTVVAALRARGINQLGGIVWADKPLEPDPLADYTAPRLAPGDALPKECGLRWLVTPDGKPFGVAAQTGPRPCFVFWDSPGGAIPQLLGLAGADTTNAPALVVLSESLSEELRPGTLKALAHVAPLCVLNGRLAWTRAAAQTLPVGVTLASGTELSLRPHGGKLALRQFGNGGVELTPQ